MNDKKEVRDSSILIAQSIKGVEDHKSYMEFQFALSEFKLDSGIKFMMNFIRSLRSLEEADSSVIRLATAAYEMSELLSAKYPHEIGSSYKIQQLTIGIYWNTLSMSIGSIIDKITLIGTDLRHMFTMEEHPNELKLALEELFIGRDFETIINYMMGLNKLRLLKLKTILMKFSNKNLLIVNGAINKIKKYFSQDLISTETSRLIKILILRTYQNEPKSTMFLSHSGLDFKYVAVVFSYMQVYGYGPWVDRFSSDDGVTNEEMLRQSIHKNDQMIVFVSDDSKDLNGVNLN